MLSCAAGRNGSSEVPLATFNPAEMHLVGQLSNLSAPLSAVLEAAKIAELRSREPRQLISPEPVLRPPSLLSLAAEVLSVAVHDESVTNTDRIDRLSADRDRGARGGGWTGEALDRLLVQLEAEAPVQAAVLA